MQTSIRSAGPPQTAWSVVQQTGFRRLPAHRCPTGQQRTPWQHCWVSGLQHCLPHGISTSGSQAGGFGLREGPAPARSGREAATATAHRAAPRATERRLARERARASKRDGSTAASGARVAGGSETRSS